MEHINSHIMTDAIFYVINTTVTVIYKLIIFIALFVMEHP